MSKISYEFEKNFRKFEDGFFSEEDLYIELDKFTKDVKDKIQDL